MNSSVLILTTGEAKLANGVDPSTQNIITLTGSLPCVSRRTIAKSERGTYYCTPVGIAIISPNGGYQLLTEGRIGYEWWKSLKPQSMHAVLQHEQYFVWWQSGLTKQCAAQFWDSQYTGAK